MPESSHELASFDCKLAAFGADHGRAALARALRPDLGRAVRLGQPRVARRDVLGGNGNGREADGGQRHAARHQESLLQGHVLRASAQPRDGQGT